MAVQSDITGLVSHSKLSEAGLEKKRVDVAHRLDERISELYGFCSACKTLPRMEQQHALGGHEHEISNASFTATTFANTLQMPHSVKPLEQFIYQTNDKRTRGAKHDILRLCGSALLDAPSTQTGRDILRLCGSRVETIHQSTQKSTVAGKHQRDLEFHIRRIHAIEQRASSLSETSTTDSSQARDAHSIPIVSRAVNLDSSRSINLNHSTVSSQSPQSVSEDPNSVRLHVQEEETMACDVDVTQIVHQSDLACECNLTHECNLTCEQTLREELEAEQLKVAELRLEVHATLQNLDDERERAVSREQELTHEGGMFRKEGVPMQANCASCKNYQLQAGDLETALAEVTREHALAVDDCAELANLRLQLAHEIEQRTLLEQACNAANAAMEDYMLRFEELNTECEKQEVSLAELEKINVGLQLQSASHAQVDKQRQDLCDHQSALLRRLEEELEQTQRDLVIQREYVVRLLLQIQQLQLEVKREKERSSSQELQLHDAFEEIKQHDHDCPPVMNFARSSYVGV